jgi:hypothetical protein
MPHIRVEIVQFADSYRWAAILAVSMTVSLSAQIALPQTVPAGRTTVLAYGSEALPAIQERELNQHNDQWSIDVKYPELAGADAFNLAIHRNLDSMVNDFKRELPETDGNGNSDYGAYLKGTYRAQVLKSGVISVLFDHETYFPGAAHPVGELASINYDSKADRLLALSDLFRPKSGYVSRLSEMAIQSLDKNEYADVHAVRRGAGPVESNFKVFTLTDAELVLHFQTYQVAAGAAGSQQVVIPLASHRLGRRAYGGSDLF